MREPRIFGREERVCNATLLDWLKSERERANIADAEDLQEKGPSTNKSFGMECSHRIDAHGAQCRDVTRGDGDGCEYGGYAGKGGGIVGRDAVKQAGHEVRNHKCANQAYAGADGGQTEALA